MDWADALVLAVAAANTVFTVLFWRAQMARDVLWGQAVQAEVDRIPEEKVAALRTLITKLHEETNTRLEEHIRSRAHRG